MFTHSEPGEISWHALVPAKAMHAAKSRLNRHELVAAFLTDTVTALIGSPRVGCVSVITSDRGLEALAKGLGAQTVLEPTPSGLLSALELGMYTIQPSMGTVIALSDLPLKKQPLKRQPLKRQRLRKRLLRRQLRKLLLVASSFDQIDGRILWMRPSIYCATVICFFAGSIMTRWPILGAKISMRV